MSRLFEGMSRAPAQSPHTVPFARIKRRGDCRCGSVRTALLAGLAQPSSTLLGNPVPAAAVRSAVRCPVGWLPLFVPACAYRAGCAHRPITGHVSQYHPTDCRPGPPGHGDLGLLPGISPGASRYRLPPQLEASRPCRLMRGDSEPWIRCSGAFMFPHGSSLS